MTLRVTGNLNDLVGEAYSNGSITVNLLTPHAARGADVVLKREVVITADASGDIDQTFQTPDDAADAYLSEWILPDGQTFRTELSTGSDTTIQVLMLAAANDTTTAANSLSTLLSAHGSTAGGHTASVVTNVPAGNLAATTVQAALDELQTDVDGRAATSHAHATTDITSGTLADARVAESNVTQHQAALSVTESQISDLGTYKPEVKLGEEIVSILRPDFDTTESVVSMQYVDASTRYIWQKIKWAHWNRIQLDKIANNSWVVGEIRVYRVYDAVDSSDAGYTFGGTGAWGTDSNAAAVGAHRRYGYADDHYMEFEVSGTKSVTIIYSTSPLGGYVKAEIDNSQSLTKEFMTDLVGSDYVWSTYNALNYYTNPIKIADNLDPSRTYTVKLSCLPVATIPPGSSDNRFYFEGWSYDPLNFAAPGVQDVDNTYILRLETICGTDNGDTINYTPSGAASPEFSGSRHLNENLTSVSWADENGRNVDVDATETLRTATSIVLTHVLTARHSETSTTDHATVTRTTTFDRSGIHCTVAYDWSSTATIAYNYIGYMVLYGKYGKQAGDANLYTLTADDDSLVGNGPALVSLQYGDAHDYSLLTQIYDAASVWNYLYGDSYFKDTTGDGGKYYCRPISSNYAVSSGDKWRFSWSWRIVESSSLASKFL